MLHLVILSDVKVNVEEAVSIGCKRLASFIEKLPGGFYDQISVEVSIMKSDKKGVRIGEFELYNTEAIYARVIGLLATGQTALESVLKHELAPFPTAMFEDTGDMRIDHSKSKFKNKLKVEVTSRSCDNTNATIIDGNAVFWTFEWPKNCLLEHIAENMYTYVKELLYHQDVYLVFDRYKIFSPKSSTRSQRAKNIAFLHHLTLQTVLPSKEGTLSCAGNKVQLIDIISEYITNNVAKNHFKNTLMITGSEDIPIEVCDGNVSMKNEMRTTHEEADMIIVQQCYWLIKKGCTAVKIISDDTDVFALACYFYPKERDDIKVFMEATSSGRSVIDIGESVHRNSELVTSILQAHAISGCDSVCKYHGIGKLTVIKVMYKKKLWHLGNIDLSIEDVMQEATEFIGLCYNINGRDLSSQQFNSWVKRSQGKLSSPPKLCSIPPTTESFHQNVLRAHYQCIVWNTCLDADLPNIDPTQYGWKRDEANETLLPIMVPKGVEAIPKEVLKIFDCACSSDEPCSKGNCSCRKVQLSCTFNCKCYQSRCFSEWTINKVDSNLYDADTHEEDNVEK